MIKFSPEDEAALARKIARPRGRPVKYSIDHLEEWGVYVLPEHLDGKALLNAVKSVIEAGKRRGWTMARTTSHRVVRMGRPSTKPVVPSGGEAF